MGNTLRHHGILGMKWGVRRFQNKDGTLTSAGKKRAVEAENHEDYTKSHTSKPTSAMSDKELREIINRFQMEKQYSQLTQDGVNKGKQYMEKFMKVGTTIAAVTTTALTIYNNAGKIKDIIEKVKPKG